MVVAQLVQTSLTADQQRKARLSVGRWHGAEDGWLDDSPGGTTVADVT